MTRLIYRMVIVAVAGRGERLRELYGDYLKMRHLHVSIREIIGAKKRTA